MLLKFNTIIFEGISVNILKKVEDKYVKPISADAAAADDDDERVIKVHSCTR